MLLNSDARGVFPIAPTPFFDDGSIDLASVDRLTDFYLGCGATGITVLGQLGEAPKLEHDEAVTVAARMIRRAARLPVVVGVSAPGFAAMRALTRAVMDEGAAGVMIAPPHTLRTDDQIVGYYRQAVEAIGAGRAVRAAGLSARPSRVQMTPAVIRRIVSELPSCVMLKHEDWPGLEKISALRGFERDGSMRRSRSCAATAACSSTTRWSAAPTAPTPATASPTCCATWCGCLRTASARRRTICSTPTCRCCATSSSRASGWRCASTC